MSRRRLAALILGAWIVSLGWLVKREVFAPTGARLAEAALRVPPGAVYYRLAVAERQVGYASSTIDTSSTTIRVTDVLVLQIPTLGTLRHTAAMSRATLSRTLRFERVDAKFAGDIGRFAARGLMTGDSVLTFSMASGIDSETTRVPVVRPIVLSSILPLRLAFGSELKPGKVYTSTVFDPMLLAQRAVDVTVVAESTLVVPDSAGFDSTTMAWVAVHFDTVRAFRIEERSGGSPMTAWIDAQGHILRAANTAGFTMERTAFELAYVNFRHRDTARVARASANPGPGEVVPTTALVARAPPDHDTLALLRLRLSGAAPAGPDFTTGRQRLARDTLVVRRQAGADLAAAYRLPARDPGLASFLAPAPRIESDDAGIREQARLIVGGEGDPARAARLIHDWVASHVEAKVDSGAPGAVRVLETRRGDCNERTVLYVALARAAGLPARAVAGLLYRSGRFYYHAWPEVYLGAWVAVDPTLDQFPADAAHVRFVIGGLARQVELVRLIGSLKLEVL
ncbi:MAG TPA: transglutaminase-like domain-containing protein [Gemmatimonadales bacterium]